MLIKFAGFGSVSCSEATGNLDWEREIQQFKIPTPKSKIMALGSHAQLVRPQSEQY